MFYSFKGSQEIFVSIPCVMTFYKHLLLRIRNLCYELFPNLSESIEVGKRSERYRKLIKVSGFVLPLPPHIKRAILHRFIIDHKCTTLVETGTQYGDTPWTFRNSLTEIFSIELSTRLASLARYRFRKFPQIHILEGDSSKKLKDVLPLLKSKTLFWLDGHYSAGVTAQGHLDCPIYEELSCIFTDCPVPYVILIDDARCFGRDKDYPTLASLQDFVSRNLPETNLQVLNDIIIIIPETKVS